MKLNRLVYFGLALSLCSVSTTQAESKKPFKWADCEFTESYEDTAYKCAVEVVTCLEDSTGHRHSSCKPLLNVTCDDGEMFNGSWKKGEYGNYLRILGIMESGRSVPGPVLDILKDSSKGYPAKLQVYGETLSGYCSMYSPDDHPADGGMNP